MSILLRIDFDVSKALYVPSTDQFTQLPSDAMVIHYECKARPRRLAARTSSAQLEIVSYNKVSSINSCFRQIHLHLSRSVSRIAIRNCLECRLDNVANKY